MPPGSGVLCARRVLPCHPGFVAIPSNGIVCPRRSPLVSEDFFLGVGALFLLIDAFGIGLVSVFVIKPNVNYIFGLVF